MRKASVFASSGLRGYLDFLSNGVELLRRQGRYEVAVSLLEAVLANWRQKRPDGNDAQKRLIKDELEMISLCKAGLHGRLTHTRGQTCDSRVPVAASSTRKMHVRKASPR